MIITPMTRRSHHMTMKDLERGDLIKAFDDGLEVLKALTGIPTEVQKDNPACQMWRGHEHCLAVYCHYGIWARVQRWNTRQDMNDPFAIDPQIRLVEVERLSRAKYSSYVVPPWFQDVDVLRSHRSFLLRRNRAFYREVWKDVPEDWPMLWPVIQDDPTEYVLKVTKLDLARLRRGQLSLPKAIMFDLEVL